MSTKKDWLPRNHELLYNQGNATVAYLIDSVLARIGITGNALVWYNSMFIPKHDIFNVAFEDWLNPADRTITKSTTLYVAEKDFVGEYRLLYTGYLRTNPLVTDTDLVEMGLPKHPSGVKTPSTPPTTIVEATTDTSIPATIGINFRDKDAKGTAKPKHVRGVEIIYVVSEIPLTDWTLLTHSVFFTRTPAKLTFTSDERRKVLNFALRWENNIGQKGPWSNVYSVYIP
jgi:hypothetical protein